MFSQKVLETITALVIEETRGNKDALLHGIKKNRQEVGLWLSHTLPNLYPSIAVRTGETLLIWNTQQAAEEILCYWEKQYKDELAKIKIV
jgi:hypothetical protein